MAVQIANPEVVKKVARLAQVTGLSKTAAVELAVDRLLRENAQARGGAEGAGGGMTDLLAQFDQVPDRPDAFDPLEWDDQGLPR